MTQEWLGGLNFLTFLCLSIFLFDCLYIYVVTKTVKASAREPQPRPAEQEPRLAVA
jgi:hypothetical protein